MSPLSHGVHRGDSGVGKLPVEIRGSAETEMFLGKSRETLFGCGHEGASEGGGFFHTHRQRES